jgi:hypothetical protein
MFDELNALRQAEEICDQGEAIGNTQPKGGIVIKEHWLN